MSEKIQGGYIILARKLLGSEIMEKPPLYLKLFVWMLLQASFKDHGNLKRGQFFTSLQKMREAMSWKRGFNVTMPSKKEIRCILQFLTISRMIGTQKGTHGTIITILNYEHYQGFLNYEGHNEGHRQGHNIKKEGNRRKGITPEEFQGLFSTLLSRYPERKIVDQVFQTVASTRKTKRIADTIKLSMLRSWEKYSVEQVQEGIRTYLNKGYAGQGKDERYLLGIIRKQSGHESKGQENAPEPTRSLLDEYYRNPGTWKVLEGQE